MLEHINVRVPSIAASREFLEAAFPDYRERGRGFSETYGYWSHVGNDRHYIAFLQAQPPGSEEAKTVSPFHFEDDYRLMHIAYAVEDVSELMARLRARGFEPSATGDLNSHPHRRRVYYLDGNHVEWEFIEYLSEKPEERNDYSL